MDLFSILITLLNLLLFLLLKHLIINIQWLLRNRLLHLNFLLIRLLLPIVEVLGAELTLKLDRFLDELVVQFVFHLLLAECCRDLASLLLLVACIGWEACTATKQSFVLGVHWWLLWILRAWIWLIKRVSRSTTIRIMRIHKFTILWKVVIHEVNMIRYIDLLVIKRSPMRNISSIIDIVLLIIVSLLIRQSFYFPFIFITVVRSSGLGIRCQLGRWWHLGSGGES